MPKPKAKRTRKQKELIAQRKVAEQTYSLSQISTNTIDKPIVKEKEKRGIADFFNYNIHLIYKDIVKTILISSVLITILVAISFYLK